MVGKVVVINVVLVIVVDWVTEMVVTLVLGKGIVVSINKGCSNACN